MSGCRATSRLTVARLSQMWVGLHDDRARFWPAVASVQADGSAAGEITVGPSIRRLRVWKPAGWRLRGAAARVVIARHSRLPCSRMARLIVSENNVTLTPIAVSRFPRREKGYDLGFLCRAELPTHV